MNTSSAMPCHTEIILTPPTLIFHLHGKIFGGELGGGIEELSEESGCSPIIINLNQY